MISVVPVDDVMLDHALAGTRAARSGGLAHAAVRTFDDAIRRTSWGEGNQRRVALVDGSELLASAEVSDLIGLLDHRFVRICGIGALQAGDGRGEDGSARELLDRLLADAGRTGADLALLFLSASQTRVAPPGFHGVPTFDLELRVAESARHGAPMTLVRGGADRDLAAIVSMGQTRADQFRFHLSRDVEFVKHAITRSRLLAGLATAGTRELQFVIAEEGITAAAYLVMSVAGQVWTIEECGDRDPSGARVGAILQALIAREPAERRPLIRGWLPLGFLPPQVTILSARPSADVVLIRAIGPAGRVPLSRDDVLFWRSDLL